MSKIVKGAVRAVGSVVKGVAKVAKTVVKSPIGRIALTAAGIYFGLPAVQGLFGAGATGTVLGNLSAAGSSLLNAGSSVAAGNFADAGSQLLSGSGLGGAAGFAPDPTTGLSIPASDVAARAVSQPSSGIFGQLFSPNSFANSRSAPALIGAGASLLGGFFQGRAAQEQQDREQRLAQEERDRRNRNLTLTGIDPTRRLMSNFSFGG